MKAVNSSLTKNRRDEQADHQLATFFNGLRENTLESFEIISFSNIGVESFLALSCHRDSLTELKLSSLTSDSILALAMLKRCTALKVLHLEDLSGSDFEVTHYEIFVEVIAWLHECKRLQEISLKRFTSAPALLTPLLLDNRTHLLKLAVEGYIMRDNREFHQALAHQETLESLWLGGDGEIVNRDDLDIFVESLSKLPRLRELSLRDVSDYFNDEHIRQLARNLPELEGLWTSGLGITDAIWKDMSRLRKLKRLDFAAMTSFSADGILQFISDLGPGNKGLVLVVMNADVGSNISDEEQAVIRETLATKLDGRWDFTLMRGMTELDQFTLSC